MIAALCLTTARIAVRKSTGFATVDLTRCQGRIPLMDTDTVAFADFGEYEIVDVAPVASGDYMDFCDIFE